MSHYYDLKSYCRPKANSIMVYAPTEPVSLKDSVCRDVICTCKSNMSPKSSLSQPLPQKESVPKVVPKVVSSKDSIEKEPKRTDSKTTDSKEYMITWTKQEHVSTSSPEVNGPPFWFTLHNGAAHLPEQLSPISAQRIRNFIDGIPEMQPCAKCAEHSRSYIELNKARIQSLKKGDDVFKFFVDFHNYVNEFLGKPKFTYDQARDIYKNGNNITVMKYS